MHIAAATAAAVLALSAAVPDTPAPPATPKKPVTDTYFGTAVVDDYRWLENYDDRAVQDWSDAQNARARKILDALPNRGKIEKRLTELLSFESPSYGEVVAEGGVYFAVKSQPPKQQPFIVTLGGALPAAGAKVDERVVVDPNDIDKTGGTSMDFFVPSPDGKKLAVSLSQGGSETGTVHVFVATDAGAWRDVESVPRANTGTAGGTLAWKGDGSGFWYTRHPQAPEVGKDDDGFFQQVAFHKLGTPASADVVELGAVTGGKQQRDDLPRNAENFLEASEDGRFISDLVQKGDGGEFELWLRSSSPKSRWRKVAAYDDRIVAVRFAPDGTLWCLSRKDASKGKLLRLAATAASASQQAQLVVPEGEATIESFEVTAHSLFLVEQLGGPSRVRTMRIDVALAAVESGEAAKNPGVELALLPISSVAALVRAKPAGADAVVFAQQSFTVPRAWFVADAIGAVKPTALAQKAPADMSDVVVQRRTAKSKDGTEVPYTVISLNGVKVGDAPTLLTGYGGFSVSIAPSFNKGLRAWLEQGGVYVVANMRGGGEYGEAWHQDGMKLKKQHVFDDFIAVAEALTSGDAPITKPARLAIQGGSNGGLLMGAALTQRPDLFAAVVAQVGYFDMLRYETKPNGAFNSTEYGSVANEQEWKALYAYSPYHHVVDGTKYPPTLFMTGKNDPRVDPLHSRKMVARLQAAKANAILRTSGSTGHGGGTPLSARIAESVDIYSFLFAQLGVVPK